MRSTGDDTVSNGGGVAPGFAQLDGGALANLASAASGVSRRSEIRPADSTRPIPRHLHHRGGRRSVAIIDQHVAHERVLFER
jgi:hypothetical protein